MDGQTDGWMDRRMGSIQDKQEQSLPPREELCLGSSGGKDLL